MERCGNNVAEENTGFQCVQCGSPIKTLYIQYSPGNIRLMKCDICKVVADEYIECEIMILIIDLILHKPKAYRHVFYNMFTKRTPTFQVFLWKSILAYFLLDLYRMWALSTNEKKWKSSKTLASFAWEIGKILIHVIFGNLAFLCILLHATKTFLSAPDVIKSWEQKMLVVLLSSYFKIFLLAMMVWKLPSSMIFITDLFVLSSNIVALKVITKSSMMRCMVVCGIANELRVFLRESRNQWIAELALEIGTLA